MTEVEFQGLAAKGYTRIPVIAEATADLHTPLAVYAKLANGPFTYLLESVVGGERFGRYSFVGLTCAERIEARGRTVKRVLRDARGADVCLELLEDSDPIGYVRGWLRRQRVAPAPASLRRRPGRLFRLRDRAPCRAERARRGQARRDRHPGHAFSRLGRAGGRR
jgi:anthranilate synthase component 1